jgi:hypothetical protein
MPQSYSILHNVIRAQLSSDRYVADLCDALERLSTVASSARTNRELAAVAFDDEEGGAIDSQLVSYVNEMRLTKIVQRIWMLELAKGVHRHNPWSVDVEETSGQALMNIFAELRSHSHVLGKKPVAHAQGVL